MNTLLEKIQQEFDNLPEAFAAIRQTIESKDSLVTYMARHPFFEIEPFEDLLKNELITEEQRKLLFVTDPTDVDISYEELYTFTADPKSNRIVHRIKHLENQNRHETVFVYEEDFHKSLTLSVYGERVVLHNVCHLFFKNGIPDLYLECTHSGITLKKYGTENGRLTGYHQKDTFSNYICNVAFLYDTSGNIDVIKKYVKGENPNRPEILFKRPEPGLTLDIAFKKMEDFFVNRIREVVQQHVRINEQAYCLLLEYCMPEAFPPELAIGVVPDLEGPWETLKIHQKYNTPDLRYYYYSDEDKVLIDLYDEEIQYLFLLYYRGYNYFKYERLTFEYWDEKVKQVYLNICQRLMHVDFSISFNRSEHFLVLARGSGYYDADYFYYQMRDYKKYC